MGARDQRRAARRRRADHRVRPALAAEHPALAGVASFAGPAFHTAQWRHDVPLAGKRVAVIGTGCSAVQVVPAIAEEVASLAVYQRSPGWTIPKLDFAYSPRAQALFERFPALQRLDRASVFYFHEFFTHGMTRHLRLLKLLEAAGRFNIRRGDQGPGAAWRVTPADVAGCKRVMLTDDWYPALARPDVELVTDGHLRDHAGRHPHARRRGASRRRDRARDRVQEPRVRRADGDRGRRRPDPGRGVGDGRARLPRRHRARLPEPVPALRAQHQRRDRLGGLHDRVLDRATWWPRCASSTRPARRRSRCAARPPTRSTPPCARRWRGTVWHTGCTNWYVDEHGNDPRSGRGRGSSTAAARRRSTPTPTRSKLERLAARVAGVEVVPEADLGLAVDPAQVDLGVVADRTGSRSGRCRGRAGRSRGGRRPRCRSGARRTPRPPACRVAATVGRRARGQGVARLRSVSRARASRRAASLVDHPRSSRGFLEREVTACLTPQICRQRRRVRP